MALDSKNNTHVVDDTIPKPEESSPRFHSWMRNNNTVSSWLLSSVSKEISVSVIYAANAAEIWKELQDRFQQKNNPRVFQLKKNLLSCTQGSLTVSAYYTQFKSLWEELGKYRPVHTCHYGGVQPIVDHLWNKHILTFLMGLTEAFNQDRGQILLMDPLPSISVVLSMVTHDEKQREVTTTMPHTKTPMPCLVQGNPKNFKKDRPTCAHCGVIGHFKEKCFKLYGYPPGYKKTQAYKPS